MNLLSLLAGLTKRDPHATIAIDADPGHPVHVSRSELWRRTLQLRADLATAGVGRGDAVAVWLPNWSEVLDWHIATASLGAHTVGLGLDADTDEVARVVRAARPRVVALAHGAGERDLTATLREALARAEVIAPPAVAVVAGPHGTPPLDPALHDVGGGAWLPSASTAGMPMPVTSGDEPAVAFGPRLAAHRESAVVRHALAVARAIGIRDDDAVLCVHPLTGAFGCALALAALAGGATCVLEPVTDAGLLLADMERFDVTQLAVTDEVALRLAGAWQRRPRELRSWRWLGVAEAVGSVQESATWAEKEFGVVSTGLYGSPELFGLTALWPPGSPAPHRWWPGGHPVSPELEVRVADPLTGRPVPAEEQGELQFRGYAVADAHLGDDPAERPLTEDGWFRTGERGSLVGDGGFRYLGAIPVSSL
ncbi:AMP-binding protein [Prauserella muralis]|uniref:AMP-dependent synthetase/ligase domain-containing protein n=1 Tax=Prauserella muralis TaxID=588067 RepID=A0A2V4BF22_9PSEU|nr:AMP-binding protein [Prauserella muralis]PXY28199.1 hypothetical protein BAY60_17890 [Prauserella muralis]